MKEDDLDNLFRKGLGDPGDKHGFREEDWDAMEQLLDKGKKRPAIVYWLPVLGSAAAIVLVFLGWLFLKPDVVKPAHHGQQSAINLPAVKNTGISGGPTRQTTDSVHNARPASYAENPDTTGNGHKKSFFITLSAGRRKNTGLGYADGANNDAGQQDLAATKSAPANIKAIIAQHPVTDSSTNAVKTPVNDVQAQANNTVQEMPDSGAGKAIANNTPYVLPENGNTTPALSRKQVKVSGKQNRPQFAIGVLASSDLNGVNSLSQTRVGGNFGLAFSATIKKWTISTGASYSIKPYLTGADEYHTSYVFANQLATVSANCRMIDIPLNVNYQVYGKHRNKITVGSGLSSYIILREDYTFNYVDPNATGPKSYSIINKNHNIFGILNLDATYEHQVNSKMGITLQPYYKLPLSNVGQSQVRLQTAGVAVGITWNFNPRSKP